jgi:ABC-2 type transport system ATP-binding protein
MKYPNRSTTTIPWIPVKKPGTFSKGVLDLIWIGNVSKSYGESSTLAVDGLQLTIPAGVIFGFLGPNGAGKTTTIKMMSGIISPDRGDIQIGGDSVIDRPLEVKRRIGYVPDSPELFPRLTGWEYLCFLADVYQVPEAVRRERLEDLLERFAIADAVGDLISRYSRGMKQRIALVGSLIHRPAVWILDEPMVGLDPKGAAVLKEEMRRYADEGHTVFFSTHVLEVAERLCDRLAILHRGRLVASGKLQELRQGTGGDVRDGETLEQLFLELTG